MTGNTDHFDLSDLPDWYFDDANDWALAHVTERFDGATDGVYVAGRNAARWATAVRSVAAITDGTLSAS